MRGFAEYEGPVHIEENDSGWMVTAVAKDELAADADTPPAKSETYAERIAAMNRYIDEYRSNLPKER